ncbi:unnamed protein product, partial [Rotaria sordida]
AKSIGKGVVVDDTRTPTIRYEDYQLEHFIEFIVSPHICTDLPFGQKELHLSTGETLLIPLTIRNLAPQRIITQYYNYCKEYYGNTFRPLGQSSLFSILNECTASTRRSLQGLDSFSAEGSTAFDYLMSIVDGLSTLGLTANSAAELKRDLQDSRNYLKSDYKVHISCNSPVPDHCSVYALSDAADKCWYQACDHNHDQQWDRCELLKNTLAKIRKYIEEYQSDAAIRDRLLYRVQQQIQCIEDWKAHLLRTIHQDQSRIAILNNLNDETIMIHVDWAMKWLPVKYRESTVSFHMQRCTEIEPLGVGLSGHETTKGVEFNASEVQNIHNEKIEWKGVKQINNIEYIQHQTTSSTKTSTEVRVWQYWKIGPGKLYRLCDLQKNNVKINPLNVFFSTNVSVPWVNDYYEKADKDRPNDTYSDDTSSSEELSEDESNVKNTSEDHYYSFDCQVNGCVARYRHYANLLRHYTTGKHKMKLEKHSLIDKSKILFHQSLTTNHLRSTPLLSITVVSPGNSSIIPPLTQHWASQKNKPNVHFNGKQKQFLQQKFYEGVETGMKWDPARVTEDMEMLTSNGGYVFNNDECLTQAQIKSYFSRLAVKQRTMQQVPDQHTISNSISSSSTSLSTINTSDIKSMDTISMDELNHSEETDDRDLEVYSWCQMLDEARNILENSSISSATSTSSAVSDSASSTPSTKRKSKTDTSQSNKYKLK